MRTIWMVAFSVVAVSSLLAQAPSYMGKGDSTQFNLTNYFSNAAPEIRGVFQYGIPSSFSRDGSLINYGISASTGFDLLGMPIVLTTDYNSLKGFQGTNSFVTVQLDKRELRNRKALKYEQITDSLLKRIGEVDATIFEISSKMALAGNPGHTRRIQEKFRLFDEKALLETQTQPGLEAADTLSTLGVDSISDISQAQQLRHGLDSTIVSNLQNGKTRFAQFERELKDLQTRRQALMSEIEYVKSKANLFSSPLSGSDATSFLNKFLSGLTDIQLGMARPRNSQFLINGSPLVGVHFETEFDGMYGSVSAGRIYRPIWGYEEGAGSRHFTEIFGLPAGGDKHDVVQLKGGWGSPDDNHLHAGILRSWGKDMMFKEIHTVFELAGRIGKKNLRFDFEGAANPINDRRGEGEENMPSQKENFKNRMAAKGQIRMGLPKIKGVVKVEGAYHGNLFFSPGMGFQRPGLIRYEASYDQRVGRKSKIKLFYGRDSDGLLGDATTYTEFTKWGAEVEQKIGKHLSGSVFFAPVTQQVNLHRGGKAVFGDMAPQLIDSIIEVRGMMNSYLAGVTASFSRRIESTTFGITGIYRQYNMEYTEGRSHYDIVSLVGSIAFSDKFDFNVSGTSRFSDTASDFGDTHVQSVVMGYVIGAGIRGEVEASSAQESGERVYGGGVTFEIALGSSLNISIIARKLLNDAYYREYLQPIYGLANPFSLSTTATWKI